MSFEQRLVDLGIELPDPGSPHANRVRAVRTGNLVFLAGHGPQGQGVAASGKVGRDLTLDEGAEASRRTALSLLASLRMEIGSLDRVRRIVKVFGMVNCAPGFSQTPKVIDGCSDLLVEVFGPDVGRHARSAVGMAELPLDLPVEIEMVVEVSDA